MSEFPVEETVRRLSKRPGYRLVTYREVGLPHWDVPIRCRLLKKKSLSVLDEFILRSIEAGLSVSDDIAGFLVLPVEVVDAAMGRLVVSGHIIAVAGRSNAQPVHYVLSDRGKRAAKELTDITPEERTLRMAYDGLTRKYVFIEKSMRWRPRDLRDLDILEIPAFPADPPTVSPEDTSGVASVLRRITETAQHDLLTVMTLDGKREKFFVRALALIFESVDRSEEIYVQFAIDGRVSEEHDLAFAKAEGLRKLGIVGSLRDVDPVVDALLGEELIKQRADDAEVEAIRRTTENFRVQLSSLEEQAESASVEKREQLVDLATGVAKRLDDAEVTLKRIPVRVLEVHEHAPLLVDALNTAQEQLLIISPWIRAAVVNDRFIKSVRRLLESDVAVVIGYGIDDGKSVNERDRAVEKKLQSLAAEFENFRFIRLGDTHAKVLIVDHSYAVVTSFNWLSFRGDPNRPFRDERGTLITIEEEVKRLRSDYMDRVNAAGAQSDSRV
ncbi:phospholipase D-like domain-containing protein [Streptomyces bobili]|uniref:phospholipase D-like domain-containing protein n=1 Tax=Streptomyces bobili TaxID=67280 RepID=UPI000A3A6994|nr:phospholipase D-like domain-containing protein [Streptomyces bobili]